MRFIIARKITAVTLSLLLCVIIVQPAIAAYMGGELPSCHPEHGDDCSYIISGVCLHRCELCDFSGPYATPAVTSLAEVGWELSDYGDELRINHETTGGLEDVMFDILYFSGLSFDYVETVVITANDELNSKDWRVLYNLYNLYNFDSFFTPENLTIEKLSEVPANAMSTGISVPSAPGPILLKSLSLPEANIIGEQAFINCENLVSVELPLVEEIYAEAFARCASLASITLPSIKMIGEGAFKDCENLVSVELPLVEEIHAGAFAGCASLASITLPSIEMIGEGAFKGCAPSFKAYLPQGFVADNEAFDEGVEIIPLDSESDQKDQNPGSGPNSGTDPNDQGSGSDSNSGTDPSDQDPGSDPNSGADPNDQGSGSDPNPDPDPNPEPNPNPDPDPESERKPGTAQTSKSGNKSSYNYAYRAESDNLLSDPLSPAAITSAEASKAFDGALSSPGSNGKIVLRFVNKSYISLEQMREIAGKAKAKGVSAVIHADTKVGNIVINRLYIDPAKATRGIWLTTGTGAGAVLRRFEKYTSNSLAVLSLGQKQGYGMKLSVASRLELPAGTNPDKLVFYSFDTETNKYRRIQAKKIKIQNGYLRFETDCSGYIVISDGPLKKLRG